MGALASVSKGGEIIEMRFHQFRFVSGKSVLSSRKIISYSYEFQQLLLWKLEIIKLFFGKLCQNVKKKHIEERRWFR